MLVILGILHADDEVEESIRSQDGGSRGEIDLGWLPAFPHVLSASMANFLFGYHIG